MAIRSSAFPDFASDQALFNFRMIDASSHIGAYPQSRVQRGARRSPWVGQGDKVMSMPNS
jgi:hypothetical protein